MRVGWAKAEVVGYSVSMNVLITGGAGYIGSVVTEHLLQAGHRVTVLDDLSKGHEDAVVEGARFVRGSIQDFALVTEILKNDAADAVMHLAADSIVHESVKDPARCYKNNVAHGLTLLEAMRASDVPRIVFSSTAAVYAPNQPQPLTEDSLLAPLNPYGQSKLAFEHILADFGRAYGLKHCSLRYFNAAGATKRCYERHNPETHLIPNILNAAFRKGEAVTLFGEEYPTRDGTCVRDYIHVSDISRAHVLAIDALDRHDRSAVYNIGTGEGHTVREVVATVERVLKTKVPCRWADRRAGDPPELVAGSYKIKTELGWVPKESSIEQIIESAAPHYRV